MKIKELYKLYSKNYLVDTDTRKIRTGTIFFALKGENFNGNKFAKQALEKGASYCVVDEKKYATQENTILVNDVLTTLQELANYHRKQLSATIISLTGSNGKTTTKELIRTVLQTQFHTIATKGNLNNHIGVPLTLLSFTKDIEIGIVEMGANHQKEIEFLSNIAEPDFGYITNFGKAHLEGFGGVEGVIKGKSELYAFLKKNEKTAFVNPHDEKQMELTSNINRIPLNKNVEIVETHPYLKLDYNGKSIQTNLVGTYNFSNILAAISIGEYFNVSKENIIKAIESYVSDNNRSQIISKEKNTLLLDAYNANPSSTLEALKNFQQINHPRKIVVLGDMFELGDDAEKEHQAIVDFCTSLSLDKMYFVGENYYQTSAIHKFENFENFSVYIKKHPIEDSFILIKGSRGMALERLLDFIN